MWLGHWFLEIPKDLQSAKRCYEEALVMNPNNKEVARQLRQINQDLGMKEHADELNHLTEAATNSAPAQDEESAFAAACGETSEPSNNGKVLHFAVQRAILQAVVLLPHLICPFRFWTQ